jgi:hypothetical protein
MLLIMRVGIFGGSAFFGSFSKSSGASLKNFTCEQSNCCPCTEKILRSNQLPVRRLVLKAPELRGGGFEAKANFGSAALLLT